MPVWKVFLIILLSCVCMGLGMATIAIPLGHVGAERWGWLAALLSATIVAGVMLTLFLRHAGSSLDISPRGRHN